jgi:hypothetical protein
MVSMIWKMLTVFNENQNMIARTRTKLVLSHNFLVISATYVSTLIFLLTRSTMANLNNMAFYSDQF